MSLVMKFNPGQMVMTRGVCDLMENSFEFARFVHFSIARHVDGDWGELCVDDRRANEAALMDGNRIFSVYKKEDLPKLWIITEWNRSVTTVLFPDEY